MDSEAEALEERLKSFLGHLKTECGIFGRMVRRDLRLLQSAKLSETLASCFIVISRKRPRQMVDLLESLKRRRYEDGTHHFIDKLLGAARLLSQMVEPILKAASEVSILLARTFFMGFSMTVLALLARLRTLVQQILLDVVSVYNIVTSLSRERQSVKINHEGIEVFREVYPTNEDFITLECAWKTDKFVVVERKHMGEIKNQDGNIEGGESTENFSVCYQTVEPFLGVDDMLIPMKMETDNDNATKEVLISVEIESDKGKQLDESLKKLDNSLLEENGGQSYPAENVLDKSLSSSPGLNPYEQKSAAKKVAFLSISLSKPTPSLATATDLPLKVAESKNEDKKDQFYELLSAGTMKDSLL
ncbi:hypothetical protein ACFE04_024443 [Oxalis oulophora]